MECLNKLLKKLKNSLIIAVVFMVCIIQMPSFATETTDLSGGEEQLPATGTTNLPHIDMKVRQVKAGNTSQVLIECYASKISDLEILDIAFTYDNTVLEPSYISGNNKNEILNGLLNVEEEVDGEKVITERGIKYENRPEVLNPSTGLNIDEQTTFNSKSKNILSNSFEFADEYKTDLSIFAFQYLAPNEKTEALKFVINKLTDTVISAGDEGVLIGTFSFRKIGNTNLEGVFGINYIGITPGSGDNEDEIRDIENGENCEDIVVFEYEKYGSISGKISASIKDEYGNELNKRWETPTATIKIYKKDAVEIEKWNETGANYINCKMDKFGTKKESALPDPYKDPYTIETTDNGEFKLEDIEFGEYVLLIDKDYYADVIITNLVINFENKDVDLVEILKDSDKDIVKDGVINLIPGDIDNDGKMNPNTDPILYKDDAQRKKESEIDLDENIARPNTKNSNSDAIIFKAAANQYKARNKQEIKRVINL